MKHVFIINPTAGKRDATVELMEMAKGLQARHGLFVRGRLLSLSLLSQSGVMACSFPHGFPLGRISDVPSGPIQLPDCRQPAQAYRIQYTCAGWRRCRNVPQFEGRFCYLDGYALSSVFSWALSLLKKAADMSIKSLTLGECVSGTPTTSLKKL